MVVVAKDVRSCTLGVVLIVFGALVVLVELRGVCGLAVVVGKGTCGGCPLLLVDMADTVPIVWAAWKRSRRMPMVSAIVEDGRCVSEELLSPHLLEQQLSIERASSP